METALCNEPLLIKSHYAIMAHQEPGVDRRQPTGGDLWVGWIPLKVLQDLVGDFASLHVIVASEPRASWRARATVYGVSFVLVYQLFCLLSLEWKSLDR